MKGFRLHLRRYFVAGLLVTIPLALSVWILKGILGWLDGFLGGIPNRFLPIKIPGLGIILLGILIVAIGFFATNLLGKRIVTLWERFLSRIPLVRVIYGGTKQLLETILKNEGGQLRRVVLFEYPRKGLWAIGFVSGHTFDRGPAERVGQRLVSVLYPTTPNPTTGFYMLIPEEELIPLDLSVEEAFKMVISAGMVVPDRFLKSSEGSR